MFDIGWTELAIIALIALLVIGPKDLPQAMRTIAGWVKRIRGMAREFQSSVDDMMREAELDGIKEQFSAAGTDLDAMVENTIDPDGTFADEFDLGDDFVPPDDTSPPARKKTPKKKKAAKKKTTAKTGAKSKRVAAAPAAKKAAAKKAAAKKPAAKKPAPKRVAVKKAPPPASSVRPPAARGTRS